MVYDVVMIGAGLANGILATFLKAAHPELRIALLEKGPSIPNTRTWCFHSSDLTPSQHTVLAPLLLNTWTSYHVAFPHAPSKRVPSSYYAIKPPQLEHHLREILNNDLVFNAEVVHIEAHTVELRSGRKLSAKCVIDGRGLTRLPEFSGYQKFVGLHVETYEPHGLTEPTLMDATVPQLDGYRFFYVLPWSRNELLIEDTRYSNTSAIDIDSFKQLIRTYAHEKGWRIRNILSSESGVLPIPLNPLDQDFVSAKIPAIGMSGGLFHPVTGYSLPDSVRVAERVSRLSQITTESVLEMLKEYREQQSQSWNYLCLLNRMMFKAAAPSKRYRIFKRFYDLDHKLIGRFYRGELLFRDKVRLLVGKPPVPLKGALRSLQRIKE